MESILIRLDYAYFNDFFRRLKEEYNYSAEEERMFLELVLEYLKTRHNFYWTYKAKEFNNCLNRIQQAVGHLPFQQGLFLHSLHLLYISICPSFLQMGGIIIGITPIQTPIGDIEALYLVTSPTIRVESAIRSASFI